MRVEDMAYDELLELDAEGGELRFAGQRALLLDAVAMGLLRKHLVDNLGFTVASTLLTRFGFTHGWRTAEAMHAEFAWTSDEEWSRAGARLHTLQGLFSLVPGSGGPLSPEGLTVSASYEAEQYLVQFGRSDEPVCATISGLASGYVSRSAGKEILVLEDRCVAQGHAACHFVGKTKEAWGKARRADIARFDGTAVLAALPTSMQQLAASLKEAERKLRAHRRLLRLAQVELDAPLGLVAKSAAMRRVIDLARRVALVDTTVLITGESGVGKERIAQLIHHESSRSGGPFVAVNCGAITETLLESELFGHARGAFTGATQERVGLFEAAHNGTLLLDEVGEVSMGMQVKLLRALQEREVRRVGENRSRPVNVRVLAATNRNLVELIEAREFRQDLYYRLNVVQLHVPPLRDRVDDLLPLARVLLSDACRQHGRKIKSLSPQVADHLVRYRWPGNVRELENAMQRAAVLGQTSQVELDDLPEEVRQAPVRFVPMGGAVRPLAEIEKDYILTALAVNGSNQSRTAEQLQIGTATLYRKLKLYEQAAGETPPSPDAHPSQEG